ncbi:MULTISPECIES: Rz1-like lysis system protein LysC [Hafniaceae]|uniref:Rz1-like lysis system protein LysC n=1 Tax=Hafniaceae TaxID=1903412 RepID=UPI001D118659|nr:MULTISPECIES: Rz1-like lysis system protein LysC [Hafniaceae]MCE9922060.1 Rz1-like lysis system protein LysC [Hafnia paralvei]
MKMRNLKAGLTLLCLLTLAGCNSDPPLSGPQVITLTCPTVTRCQLPARAPKTNGDLRDDGDAAEAAWAVCAAKVDMIVDCQENHHEKA